MRQNFVAIVVLNCFKALQSAVIMRRSKSRRPDVAPYMNSDSMLSLLSYSAIRRFRMVEMRHDYVAIVAFWGVFEGVRLARLRPRGCGSGRHGRVQCR